MWNKLQRELRGSSLELVALNVSLVDIIWTEGRSPKRSKDAFILGVEYAGILWIIVIIIAMIS